MSDNWNHIQLFQVGFFNLALCICFPHVFFFFNWGRIALQCCVSFCCILQFFGRSKSHFILLLNKITIEWERLEIPQKNWTYQGNTSCKDRHDKEQKW